MTRASTATQPDGWTTSGVQFQLRDLRQLLWAVAAEAGMLLLFLSPPVASVLGGTWPSALGWAVAAAAIPALLGADAAAKAVQGHGFTAATSSPRPRT